MNKLLASAIVWAAAALPAHADLLDHARSHGDLLTVNEAFNVSVDRIAPRELELVFTIAPGTYLYQERLSIEATEPAAATLQIELPPGTPITDEHFGEVHIYRDQLLLNGTLATDAPVTVRVRYQGCADAGLCYPPQTRTFTLPAGS